MESPPFKTSLLSLSEIPSATSLTKKQLFSFCNPLFFSPGFALLTKSAETATTPAPLLCQTLSQTLLPKTARPPSFMQPSSPSNNSQTKRFLSDSMMTRVDPRLAFKSIHDGQSESDTWPNVLQQIKPQHGGLHCHSKIVLSWKTDALRFSKHLWRR